MVFGIKNNSTQPQLVHNMYVCMCAGVLCYFVPRPTDDTAAAYTLPAIVATIAVRHNLRVPISQLIAELRSVKLRRAQAIARAVTAYAFTDSIETPSFYPCPVAILEAVPLDWIPFYIKLWLAWLKTGQDKRVFTNSHLRQAGGPHYTHRLKADNLFVINKVPGGVTLSATEKLKHALPKQQQQQPAAGPKKHRSVIIQPAARPVNAPPKQWQPEDFDAVNNKLKQLAAGEF